MKSFALSLTFIVRFTATRKWPIEHQDTFQFVNSLKQCCHARKSEKLKSV